MAYQANALIGFYSNGLIHSLLVLTCKSFVYWIFVVPGYLLVLMAESLVELTMIFISGIPGHITTDSERLCSLQLGFTNTGKFIEISTKGSN